MAEPTSPAAAASPPKATPARRVAELNDIDKSLSHLLEAAADAIGVLTNKSDDNVSFATLEAQRGRLERAADTYYATLSSIEVRLKRQVYALEEAGLIQHGEEIKDKDKNRRKAVKAPEINFESTVGGGPLDPSWLNARADKGIEYKVEKEILDQAKGFIETTKIKPGSESAG